MSERLFFLFVFFSEVSLLMKGLILWCVVIEEKLLFLLNLQILNLQIEACSSTIECFSFHGNTFTSGFLPPLKTIEGKTSVFSAV